MLDCSLNVTIGATPDPPLRLFLCGFRARASLPLMQLLGHVLSKKNANSWLYSAVEFTEQQNITRGAYE